MADAELLLMPGTGDEPASGRTDDGTACPDRGVMTYEGRRYLLFRGRVVLDWRDRPVRFHPENCLLCCTYRVVPKPGASPKHPDPCPNCGWNTRLVDVCRFCGRTAHLTDDDRRPVHKACLEHHITRGLNGAVPDSGEGES